MPGIAEIEILVRVDRMLIGSDGQPRGEAIAGGRRAVEIVRFDVELQRFARLDHRLRAGKIELQSLGQEFLDAEREALRGLLALRIGAEFDLPATGRRIGGNFARPLEVVEIFRIELCLGVRPSIRLLQGEEQRLRLDRIAVVVAQQRGETDRLARTVEIAIRPAEHVEPGFLAAGDGEIGKVERRLVERQQRDILARARDEHVLGIQRVGDLRVAVRVGLAGDYGFAFSVEHGKRDAAERLAALQRSGVHEQLVLVRARVQADVADEEEAGFVFAFERCRRASSRRNKGPTRRAPRCSGSAGSSACARCPCRTARSGSNRPNRRSRRPACLCGRTSSASRAHSSSACRFSGRSAKKFAISLSRTRRNSTSTSLTLTETTGNPRVSRAGSTLPCEAKPAAGSIGPV